MYIVWDTLSGEKKTGLLEFAEAERKRDFCGGEIKGFYVFPEEEEEVKKPSPPTAEKTGAGNGELLLF